MNRDWNSAIVDVANQQGAEALLTATLAFLRTNNISKRAILRSIRQNYGPNKPKEGLREYRKVARAYEDMGIVMSTWFSSQRFLDKDCRPLPLTAGPGPHSLASLVRAARVSITPIAALDMMRRSASIRFDPEGNLHPLRREFVLRNFAIPRAALVIERYLDTLHKNSSPKKGNSMLLLERHCHVPEVNINTISPILRDIKKRGSAYIDSVNGDIESLRLKQTRHKQTGEMSVHIFAWTRFPRSRRPNHID
jgi:hypothetical protein